MSVIFNIENLSEEATKKIIKDLTIIPVDPREKELNSRGIYSRVTTGNKDPVLMFYPDPIKKLLYLPYFYAKELLQNKKINFKPEHQKVFGVNDTFSIQLRPEQEEICTEALIMLKEHNTKCSAKNG